MNTIKFLAAFVALAAVGRAESVDRATEQILQLPPVVVVATRLPDPAADMRVALNEARAQVSNPDLTRRLDRTIRRLANLHRAPAAAAKAAAKPNV
jgi:hypothetical protein